jgi:outer membrane protein OmpA-like peptidoglycan-associated protein
MKPNTITKILVCSFLITFIFSLGACQMKSPGVQIDEASKPLVVSKSKPKDGPPPYVQANGYGAKYSYRYYPQCYVYFDLSRGCYFYQAGDVWKASESLPVGMDAQLGEYVNIEMESDRPYTKFKEHKEEYPPTQFSNYHAEKDLHVLVPEHKAKITFQTFGEDKLLTSVLDAEDNPIRGLKEKDFIVQSGIKKAKILSVKPLETSKEVPLNIVLVVDNSYSMEERQAVDSLLSALEEFFKTLRPIDNIHAVVFANNQTMKVNEYSLHTKTFHSSEGSELRDFFRDAFSRGMTSGTYLYEAMVAGIDLIRRTPERDQKFMVVFSDGADLNSSFDSSVVSYMAEEIPNFEAYCIDYMPKRKMNRFLESFAESHGGRIWKAESATELLPIFQTFTSTLLYRYVVSYRVLDPPRGTLNMEPTELSFDILTMVNGSPLTRMVFFETGNSEIPESYVLFMDKAQAEYFDERNLETALDKYYNVLNLVGKDLTQNPLMHIRIVGCNSNTGLEKENLDLSKARAEAVKDYLSKIWGIDAFRMKMEARNLPANPTSIDYVGSRPENQRVEIIFDPVETQDNASEEFVVEINNRNEIRITPELIVEHGIANWELTILADNQPIKILKGTDELEPSYTFSFDEFGYGKLVTFGYLEARIRVEDIHSDTYETSTGLLPIEVSKKEVIHELASPPHGSLAIEPTTLTIEELSTIDSSPLLNYVFFETGRSEIPEWYVAFKNQAETETFEESNLSGTMEKYYHILNIIGKRLVGNPDVTIKIIGCNSDWGEERGRKDLSRSRAESVRSYLKYIWGIDSSRMEIKARNLPSAASNGNLDEGRAENQRVEIYSDFPEVLDIIKSSYVEEITQAKEIRILPQIQAGYEIAHWKLELTGDGELIESFEGKGDPLPAYTFAIGEIDLQKIGSYNNIEAAIEVKDKKGQIYRASASSSVRFIRREQSVAQKMSYKVLEKYALILFDFNSVTIKERNKTLIHQIVKRIKEIPDATVTVIGHTDSIGKEDYNIELSKRRAQEAYKQILASGLVPSERITYEGAGPYKALYDNGLPQGRAFNRTVTVALEYEENS